ncbi:MAG TPA: MEDS domain-containing protein, partial [Candidatus Polarisedimenticolia bacterium]|nr:MEDS domain-containing protein [Candidatus Polarisedimenticolia bacterium]
MKKLELPSSPFNEDLPGSPRHAATVTQIGKSHHVVQFYETDEFLAKQVSAFIAEGLEAGSGGIVIATPQHRDAIDKLLSQRGIDLASAGNKQQFF